MYGNIFIVSCKFRICPSSFSDQLDIHVATCRYSMGVLNLCRVMDNCQLSSMLKARKCVLDVGYLRVVT